MKKAAFDAAILKPLHCRCHPVVQVNSAESRILKILNKRKSKSKQRNDDAVIDVGLKKFNRQRMTLKAQWGKRLPLKVHTDSTHENILEKGLTI